MKITRWSSTSADHVMMGAGLEGHPPIAILPATGETLRRERLRAKLSLLEVGERFRSGISRQRVSKIEKQLVVSDEIATAYRAAVKLAKAQIAAALEETNNQITARRLGAGKIHGPAVREFENRKLNYAR
jgi:transcriptional regulator with XRE-family HTH domain